MPRKRNTSVTAPTSPTTQVNIDRELVEKSRFYCTLYTPVSPRRLKIRHRRARSYCAVPSQAVGWTNVPASPTEKLLRPGRARQTSNAHPSQLFGPSATSRGPPVYIAIGILPQTFTPRSLRPRTQTTSRSVLPGGVRAARLPRQHGAGGPARRRGQPPRVKGIQVQAARVRRARRREGREEGHDGGLLEAGDAHGGRAAEAALGDAVEVRGQEDERRADEELLRGVSKQSHIRGAGREILPSRSP